MLHKFLVTVLLTLPLYIFAQKTATVAGFTITGSVLNLKEQETVSLVSMNRPTDTIAVTKVSKNGFLLKGTVTEPDLYQINFHTAKKKAIIFLDNSAIQVSGDVLLIQQMKFKGSQAQDNFLSFQQLFNPLFEKLGQLNKSAAEGQADNKITDSIVTAFKSLSAIIEAKVDSFVSVNKDQAIAPFVLLVTAELSQDPLLLQKRFAQLSAKQQQSFYGDILQKQIEEATFAAIGTPAPEFSQNDTSGIAVSLSSFKGKYVLIDFWASWCKPCRMENPNVVKAYDKFRSKNFTVLGVSLDRSKKDWLEAIAIDGLKWTQLSDLKYWNNAVAQQYRIQSIPQNILVDPQGIIVGKNLRGEELDAKLCELLGCGN